MGPECGPLPSSKGSDVRALTLYGYIRGICVRKGVPFSGPILREPHRYPLKLSAVFAWCRWTAELGFRA